MIRLWPLIDAGRTHRHGSSFRFFLRYKEKWFLNMKKNEIYIKKGINYKEMVLELLEACNLAEDIGNPKKKIGIKPNLVIAAEADGGAVTHPEIVDGVITYLHAHSFHNIVVLEGSWVGDRTGIAVKRSGILQVCQKHGVPFADMQKDTASVRKSGGMQLKVCDEALSLDYLINLPVLKGHCQTMMTCALKNMKGLIPNTEKRRFHTMGLHRPIAELNRIIHQDFILVDNICGDLDFEEGGNPVPMNRVLGFKDPVLCDSFAAQTMGYDPYEIDYIYLAESKGVGSADLSRAQIMDLSPEGEKERPPKPTGIVKRLEKYIAPQDACSACYGTLIYALRRLSQDGYALDKLQNKICIGQGYRGKEGELGVGNCTRCFRHTVAGCPPTAADVVNYLKKL